MADIHSRQNQQVKHVTQLNRSKVYRHEHNACVVEGARALSPFLASRHAIQSVYMTEEAYHTQKLGIPAEKVTIVTTSVMEKMSTLHTPSGILGLITLGTWQSASIQPGLCLVNISDPGNLGALIRTSVGLGHDTITCINCVDPWNQKVVQASAGTLAHAYIHTTSWEQIRQTELTTCALTAYNAHAIETISFTGNELLLVGNEAHGLPEDICIQADQRIALSIPGNAESYNAAIAGSIALYIATQYKDLS